MAKSLHPLRTRFARDIVAEFLPPAKKTKHNKVIILCDGMPTMPKKHDFLTFYSKKGYWVFHPRYRGSWESSGSFLKVSPHRDILDIIKQLPQGFRNLSTNKIIKIKPSSLYVMGGSFGGPAALLVSKSEHVDKVIARAPVVDWRDQKATEPLGPLLTYVKKAFGESYRIKTKDWQKLKQGTFYNPVNSTKLIDSKKVLIIQAMDDKIVSAASVIKFARQNNIQMILLKKGGHLSLHALMKPFLDRHISKFLKS
jgi:esterase/lipase